MRILIIEKVNLNMPVGIIHRTHQIRRVGKRQREQLRHPKWAATGDQDAHKEVQVEPGKLVKHASHILLILPFIADGFLVRASLLIRKLVEFVRSVENTIS